MVLASMDRHTLNRVVLGPYSGKGLAKEKHSSLFWTIVSDEEKSFITQTLGQML